MPKLHKVCQWKRIVIYMPNIRLLALTIWAGVLYTDDNYIEH